MSTLFKGSPYRRRHDLEAGSSRSPSSDNQDGGMSSSPFYITRTKNASIERLRRWRQAALVLVASRRFRYTLDLKKEEEKRELISKIRAHAQAVRAAYLFTQAGNQANGTQPLPPTPHGEFEMGPEQLASMTRDHNFVALQQYGRVNGLSGMLKTNLDKGVNGDDADLLSQRNLFGSNTYP